MLKLSGLGFSQYFRSRWNFFDFFLVAGSLIDELGLRWFNTALFRIFRIARAIRLARSLTGLRKITQTLYLSLPALLNVGTLLFLLLFVYAVLGVYLFAVPADGEYPTGLGRHANFDDWGSAMLVLLRTMTGEDWQVLMFGCDRWQQLGLGSPDAGAAGYTWEKGRIWQTTPRPARLGAGDGTIRQAACGADHTVALARDGATVYTWGRGEHGQLGREARMFVGAPARSSALSGGGGGGAGQMIAAVLAVGNCTATCRADGTIIRSVGKCRAVHDELLQAAAAATTPMNER